MRGSAATRDKLARALTLDAGEWRSLASAFTLLFAARLWHGALPARRLLAKLSELAAAAPSRSLLPDERRQVERFAWALAVAANHAPWRSDCLLRALAGATWLTRRRLPFGFYLGVHKSAGALAAHAWLRCDDIHLAGGEADGYTALIAPARADHSLARQ